MAYRKLSYITELHNLANGRKPALSPQELAAWALARLGVPETGGDELEWLERLGGLKDPRK